jgi:hypothetical protein
MNAFSGDENPKFVIATHASKLPAAVLIAANMDATPRQLHPQDLECLWASRSLAQSSPSRPSPRERRMIQCAESASEAESSRDNDCRRHGAQDVKSLSASGTRAFPKEWGTPPSKLSPVQAQLAEGYGVASVTLRSWMIHRMHGAPKAAAAAVKVGVYEEISCLNNAASLSESRRDDAEVGVSTQTRRMLRHPNLPWAPDGGSWSDFKTKIQLEKQKRRLEKEEADRRAMNPPCRQAVLPIVPPLLLEPVRDLLRARDQQNRPKTPLSSRHLAHQLQLQLQQHSAKSGRGGQHRAMARDCDAVSDKLGHRTAYSDEQVEEVASPPREPEEVSQRRHIQTPELLCAVAHEAELTQRLLRLGGLKKRFNELLALHDDDKKAVAAFVSQRAKIVQDIRNSKAPITARQTKPLQSPSQKCTKTQQPAPPQSLPQSQRTAHSLQLLESEHGKPNVASRRQIEIRPPRASSAVVIRQRQLITAMVHAVAVCTISSIIQNYRTRKTVVLKQQLAALTIQKLFRWKLMPYYVRQLAKAVTVLKPWMSDALLRWRRRRLNRSTDILRCMLVNCRQSNKITMFIRAFRQKVVRLQRNIRSFLSCTQARVVRLLKLLYVQVICSFCPNMCLHFLILECSAWVANKPCSESAQEQSCTLAMQRYFCINMDSESIS